jgi:hypothetical protein
MTRRVLSIVFYVVVSTLGVCAQNSVGFFDPETGMYGVKNRTSDNIIIQPKYREIIDIYNDSLFLVKTRDYKYGVVDASDKVVIKFSSECIRFHTDDPYVKDVVTVCRPPKFWEINTVFYIDGNRGCIPMDYYPCPEWSKMTVQPVSPYLLNIQKAILYSQSGLYDSARYQMAVAIKLNPQNPYVWYARASLSFDTDSLGEIRPQDDIKRFGANEYDSIIHCLNLADSFEQRPYYKLKIKEKKVLFYTYGQPNREKQKNVNREIKKLGFYSVKTGYYLIGSFSGIQNREVEFGAGLASFSGNNRFSLNGIVSPNASVAFALTWSKNIHYNIEAFRLYILSAVKPFSYSLQPILYTDYYNYQYVIRPEIGVGFGYFSLNAGYNITLGSYKFKHFEPFNLNLRIYLPLSVYREFETPNP